MMSSKSKTYHAPVSAKRGAPVSTSGTVLRAAVYAFLCGVGSMLMLMAALAILLTKSSLPLSLVRPFSGGAACVGAVVSGLVLAAYIGKKKLICGLCCGVFYALCMVVATLALGSFSTEGGNLLTLGMLLAGGVTGGAFSAAGNIGAAPANS